nr:hypothetical protein [Conexibacter arvalis]
MLVADRAGDALTPVLQLRAFTRLGRVCRAGEPVPPAAVAALTTVVAEQARAAREAGARALRAVATAALRRTADGEEVCAAVGRAAGVAVELLGSKEEARLAFAGATAALADASGDEPIAVADIGGGSSELIVGTRAGGVTWSRSLPIGSGDLAERHLRSDPPLPAELGAIASAAEAALAGVSVPPVARAVAVGGSATSLRRLVGPTLDPEALVRAVATLASAPAAEIAAAHELDPVRVHLLPAGILLLAAVAARVGPLTVAEGGLREGLLLELSAADAADAAG